MKPQICVSLPATKIVELESMIQKAEKAGADLIEIRMDYLEVKSLTNLEGLDHIMNKATVPLIATNRQYSQGGQHQQEEISRIDSLIRAAELGAQYVDLELTMTNLDSVVKAVDRKGSRAIVSFHDFQCTPPNHRMEKIIDSQIQAGATVCKLVTTAKNVEDSIRCLLLIKKMSEKTKTVCFAMGSNGILSRTLSPLFGGFFTFASLEGDLGTASGQMSIDELKILYSKLGVTE